MSKDRMARFDIFIGTWNTTGDVLATEDAPANTLSATDVYQWLPGRHFLMHHVDARFGKTASRSMEVLGYDPERKRYSSRSYDDQGACETFDVQLQRGRYQIVGQTTRFDGRFDAKQNRLTGLWELKSKTAGWQPWIKLQLIRS